MSQDTARYEAFHKARLDCCFHQESHGDTVSRAYLFIIEETDGDLITQHHYEQTLSTGLQRSLFFPLLEEERIWNIRLTFMEEEPHSLP